MKKTTKKEVIGYFSRWLEVPLTEMEDGLVVGKLPNLEKVCGFTFGKKVKMDINITVGELVRQLTE